MTETKETRMRRITLFSAALLATGAATAATLPAASAAPTTRTPPIAFTSDRDGDHEIFVRDTSGRVTQLTRNSSDDHDAVWSPDGRRLAFVSDRDGDPEIFVMRADGSRVRQLTRNGGTNGAPVRDSEPAWSPDGTRIAFTSDRDGGEPEIYVMGSDGRNQTRLTRTEPYVMNNGPDWSPNGKEIAFSSSRISYENHEIYRMRADGTDVRRVTRTADGIDDNAPAWSPNGKHIAFSSNRDGNHDLYVMGADGGSRRKLGGHPVLDDVFPRWTANGKALVFWTFPGESGTPSAEVWSMGADGANRGRLVKSPAQDSAPDPKRGSPVDGAGHSADGFDASDIARVI